MYKLEMNMMKMNNRMKIKIKIMKINIIPLLKNKGIK